MNKYTNVTIEMVMKMLMSRTFEEWYETDLVKWVGGDEEVTEEDVVQKLGKMMEKYR